MDAAQCRAARALLGISQDDLARLSKVAKRTIASFEKGGYQVAPRTLSALVEALEGEGVQLIAKNGGGAGVRLRDPTKQ
ncbi:MAG: helix-turn-helix transcriptional regulator [Tabrizicola sp.]|jgi:transcriptional regulator with XRE-family HTH domain|nr:helix-turn-helix transcriptional regulator [Tabrizicola sp.]